MPEPGSILLLGLLAVAAGAGVALPWIRRDPAPAPPAIDAAETSDARLRHRMALEALRDVEADRRAGSLDDAAYAQQRSEAEAAAAQTLGELGGAAPGAAAPSTRPATGGARRPALILAGALALALAAGSWLPEPFGIGERTVIDQALADAIAAEDARQAEIARLLNLLAGDPRDVATLSDLADAYLAGESGQDLQRGAVALLAVLSLEPDDASAYQRLITAYIRADDWTDARATTDAYALVAGPEDPDLAFFSGLVAWRGEQDADAAVEAFDRFLALAPDDPRSGMVRSLRAEAAGELP